MNTQSNALSEPLESQITVLATISPARTSYWSLRREFWENRSVYIAPLVVAAVLLFGVLIGTFIRSHRMEDVLRAAAGFLMATQMLVGIFYSLDALHGERRDRSILFWKSLPVSDLTTVLTKAAIPIVFLPLFTFVLTLATQLIMLLLSGIVLLGRGQSVGAEWAQLSWLPMSLGLLYHLVTVHALWHAPIYGWLLLVSGWARRLAFVWAVLPPLAIGIVEKIAFNTSHFASLMAYRLAGPEAYSFTGPANIQMDPMMAMSFVKFLGTPGLWIGLALTAGFLAVAVRQRRHRGPI
jgi:ABC-2 type transport system permease protein